MSCSLNSLKGVRKGLGRANSLKVDCIGDFTGVIKGDTRSLDHGLHGLI